MGIFDIFKKTSKPVIKIGGWLPDPEDKTFWKFEKSSLKLSKEATKNVDLRPYSSPRHDQLLSSSCVANSVVKALEIKRIIKHGQDSHVDLSRSFVYYYARDRQDPPAANKDNGTYIYLASNIIRCVGVCTEQLHPFSMKTINKCPSQMAAREARLNRIKSHYKIKTKGDDRLEDILFNLQAGNPVVFGTVVGESWMDYTDGVLGIENKPLGRHALTVVGYLDGNFIVENSWSNSWGNLDGFCFVKPEVLTSSDTKDLWVIVDGSEAWTEKK